VPTVAESGLPGFDVTVWQGLLAPAGTPPAIVALLNQQVNKALTNEEVRTRLAAEGAEPTPATPQAFGQLIASEIPRWDKVVKAARIHLD
jgi:tripartite-type tricarboxylate transporter receptor subunit TctC